MIINAAPAIKLVETLEGAYVNNPKDPGGATNTGITLRALEDYWKRPCTIAELKALTPGQKFEFYDKLYWPSVDGDLLPAGVDLIVYDAGVNCGRGRAVSFLQKALGVTPDGDFGPATRLALTPAVRDLPSLIERIRLVRASYYRNLSTYPTFGAGWNNRLASVAHTAQAWAVKK